MLKIVFVLALTAITISAGQFVFVYMELQEIREIQQINYEYAKKGIEHYERYAMWELTDGHSVSEKTYWNKWKSHTLDWMSMDEEYLNKLYGLMK